MRFKSLWFVLATICALSISQIAIAASRAQAQSRASQVAGQVLHVAPARLSDVPEKLQYRTISEAASAVEPGDTVVIHDGTYRESIVVAKSGTADQPIRFVAAPAARVIVSACDLLTGWRAEGRNGDRIFSVEWPHRFIGWSKTLTHPDDDHHLLVKDDLTRDFRVPPDSPALALGAYPRGDVPGVRLGVLEPASAARGN